MALSTREQRLSVAVGGRVLVEVWPGGAVRLCRAVGKRGEGYSGVTGGVGLRREMRCMWKCEMRSFRPGAARRDDESAGCEVNLGSDQAVGPHAMFRDLLFPVR